MTLALRLADLRSAARSQAEEQDRADRAAAEHHRTTVDLEAGVRVLALAIRRPIDRPLRDGDPGSESPVRDDVAASLLDYGVAPRASLTAEEAGAAFDRWVLLGRGAGLLRG